MLLNERTSMSRETIDIEMLDEIRTRMERLFKINKHTLPLVQKSIDGLVHQLGLPYKVRGIIVAGVFRCVKTGGSICRIYS